RFERSDVVVQGLQLRAEAPELENAAVSEDGDGDQQRQADADEPARPAGEERRHQDRPGTVGTKAGPGHRAVSPSHSSMRRSWLYLATRSDRDREPVLIWPAFVPTARSATKVSSVSPERWEMITP